MDTTTAFLQKVTEKSQNSHRITQFQPNEIPESMPDLTDKMIRNDCDLKIWFDTSVSFPDP